MINLKNYFRLLYSNLMQLSFFELLFRGSIMLFAMASTSVYWNMMKFLSYNEIPMTLVLTGSMEPGFIRGDAVAVYSKFHEQHPRIGDIVVWKMTKKPTPIVHRILEKRVIDGQDAYVTKGDANADFDVGIYDNGRTYLHFDELMATAEFNCPALGY